jgi:sterol 14-demethylase
VSRGFKQCGDIFSINVFHKRITFLIGPDAQAVLFNAKDEVAEQAEVYKFTVPVFGPNILYDAPMKRMAQQLKFIKHGLSGPAMAIHGQKIVQETEQYFGAWGNEGEVELNAVFNELTIMTASRCLLGNDIRERMHKQVAKYYLDLDHGMTPLTFFWPTAPTETHKKRDKARDAVIKLFSEAIEARRHGPAQDDFMQVLIDSKYTDGKVLNNTEIGGLLLAALFGGQHTSSITATWVGLLTHTHPEILPRLVEEQKQVLKDTGGKLTWDAFSNMVLLQNVVKEALRMYPPLLMLMRYVVEPNGIAYKDYVIPKGEIIIAAPPVAHRIPSVFKDPDRFDPDRWARGEGEGKMEFISFGGGRHACLGQKFGMLQVSSIWSYLLRHFDFEMIDKLPPVDYSGLVAGPAGRCRVRYRRKQNPIVLTAS